MATNNDHPNTETETACVFRCIAKDADAIAAARAAASDSMGAWAAGQNLQQWFFEEYFDRVIPDTIDGLADDLLRIALNAVDWKSVATSLREMAA